MLFLHLPGVGLMEIIKSRARLKILMATICGARIVLSTLQSSYHLILATSPRGRWYYDPHVRNEGNELGGLGTQGGAAI